MPLRRGPREDQTQPRLLEVDASMTGTLSFKDPVNLQINGQFDGTLETKGDLLIGEKARVKATIHGERLRIAGRVDGTIMAQRVELLSTARVIGKITAPTLIVQEGAVFHGAREMVSETAEPQSLSLEELARFLEVDASTILEWAESGRLPAQREGGVWRFNKQRVEEWLAQEKIR